MGFPFVNLLGAKMKKIAKDSLIIRDSFQLAFEGSEIWCEELDALSIHTDVASEKFLSDMVTIRRPSSPGLIAVHLNETLVDNDLVNIIVPELKKSENSIHKVVFVGLNRSAQKLMKSTLEKAGVSFAFSFCGDYEKAKEWLVNIKK